MNTTRNAAGIQPGDPDLRPSGRVPVLAVASGRR